jgi:hypothetical protein
MNNEFGKDIEGRSRGVLSQYLHGRVKENHEEPQSGWPVSEPLFEHGPPGYEAGVLSARPQHLLVSCKK